FSIIKGIAKDYCRTESCLELFSDYFPIVFKVKALTMLDNRPPATLSSIGYQSGYQHRIFVCNKRETTRQKEASHPSQTNRLQF
ncbi:hypothetical protein HN011_008788, partial [Eciton burchellii]